MLKIREGMKGAEESDELMQKQAEDYASLYEEYQERLATEVSNGAVAEDDYSAKLAIYDPEGESYAKFFASDDEDEEAVKE